MDSQVRHTPFCFAGEPAPCKGYFPDDVLPCVCTAEDAIAALSELALPALAGMTAPAQAALHDPEPALKAETTVAG